MILRIGQAVQDCKEVGYELSELAGTLALAESSLESGDAGVAVQSAVQLARRRLAQLSERLLAHSSTATEVR